MSEAAWQRTESAVRAAFDRGDLTGLGPLLAPDVRWHGAGPGGCHSADAVLAWIGTSTAAGTRYRLVDLRREHHLVLLHVAVEPGGPDHRQLMVLDADGLVTRLLDYTDPAAAERDLTPPAAPTAGRVRRLVPFVEVRDVARSVAFYGLLGFVVTGEYRPHDRLVWAALRSGDAELMLAEAGAPADAAAQGVLFYLYSDDLAALREHLRAHGAFPSEIADGSPGPRAEMRVDDLDGYCLMIAQVDD